MIEDHEWNIKLWCAENFGWTPDEVNKVSYEDIEKLTNYWNKKQDKLKRDMQRNRNKVKRRGI